MKELFIVPPGPPAPGV